MPFSAGALDKVYLQVSCEFAPSFRQIEAEVYQGGPMPRPKVAKMPT